MMVERVERVERVWEAMLDHYPACTACTPPLQAREPGRRVDNNPGCQSPIL